MLCVYLYICFYLCVCSRIAGGCFNYAAPAEQVEALVEQAFRICRYDAHCATRELQKDKRRESDGAGMREARFCTLPWLLLSSLTSLIRAIKIVT